VAFPIGKPYVGPAPILDQPPAVNDWGQIVRPIFGPGPFGPVIVVQPSLSTVTAVPQNLASVTIIAANVKRQGLFVFNDSPGPLFVKIGAGAGLNDWSFRVCSGAYWEAPFAVTTQLVTGIWSVAGVGNARVTELTIP